MEYQVTIIETYWIEADTAEQAKIIAKRSGVRPESVDIEVNG